MDTGTAAYTLPAATVTGVQTISLQNINGTTGVAGVTEVATVTFQNVRAGLTVTINGLTMTAGGAGASAADIATAFNTGANGTTTGNAVMSGTSSAAFTKVAGTSGTSVVYTSSTPNAAVADLAIGGTAQTGLLQTQSLTVTTASAAATATIVINGVTVPMGTQGTTKPLNAASIASTINTYLGSTVAVSDGVDRVIISSSTPISIGAVAGTTIVVTNNGLTSSNQTIVITGSTTAVTTQIDKFTYNGVTLKTAAFTTVATAATNAPIEAAAIALAINNYVGSTVATVTGATITIAQPNGAVFGNLADDTGTGVGSAGTPTVVAVSQGYTAPSPASASIVQGVATVTSTSQTDTITATNFVGATNFVSERSTGQVDVLALTSAQSVTKDAGSGALAATWGTTGVAPVINIANGSTGGAVTVTAPNATSMTLNSTGAANTIAALGAPASATALNINATTNLTTGTITAAALTTINVSGAATLVTLGTLAATTKTINGAGLTAGGITVTLVDAVTAFTGGAGVDTVTTVAGTTAASIINGGGGAGDILNVNETTSISTAALGARFTNFEVLRNTAGGATANVSTVAGITAIQLGATGQGATGMTAAQALNVTNRTNNATQTLALTTATGTSDVLTVTLLNADLAVSSDLTSATVDGFETMNVISSTGGVGDVNVLNFAAGAQLKAVNLSGAFPIVVATGSITTTGGTAFNASGVTYSAGTTTTAAFAISGDIVKGSSVRGSEFVDVITTTAAIAGVVTEFVTYDAGAGNDRISSTAAAINNVVGVAQGSVRINGGAGTDTLVLTDAAALTLVNANFEHLTNIETISYAIGNKAITINGGAFLNSNFGSNTTTTFTLGDATNAQINTVDLTGFTGNATVSLDATAAATTAQAITTGLGNDVITALVAGITTGSLAVVAGAGNDTINVTSSAAAIDTGTISLTGGTGQDTYVITAGPATIDQDNLTFVFAAGDSLLASADVIRNFKLADGTTKSYILNLAGDAVAQTAIASQSVTGYTASELQYTIGSGAAGGLLTFAGTSAAGLTAAIKASIAQAVVTDAAGTVAFTQAVGDGTTDTYVFANNSTADSLVHLVGVTAVGLGGGAMVTANFVTVA